MCMVCVGVCILSIDFVYYWAMPIGDILLINK